MGVLRTARSVAGRSFARIFQTSGRQSRGGPIRVVGSIVYETIYVSSITTLGVMEYRYTNMAAPARDPWLLTTNPCYPFTLTQGPGFALLTHDPYYPYLVAGLPYSKAPTSQYTSGKTPPRKRDYEDESHPRFTQDPLTNHILVDEGNTTRRTTEEEMRDHFGLVRCQSKDCAEELEQYERVVEHMRGRLSFPIATTTAGHAYPKENWLVPSPAPAKTLTVSSATVSAASLVTALSTVPPA